MFEFASVMEVSDGDAPFEFERLALEGAILPKSYGAGRCLLV